MFEFSVCRNDTGKVTGFDLGDIQFSFGEKEISSKGSPRLLMMVYLSVVSLVDTLLSLKVGRKCEFVGVDSSFSLFFELQRKGVFVWVENELLGVCDFCILIKAIDKGVEGFLNNGNPLPPTDPVYNDFHSALKNLKLAVAACERG